jgi:hypothetical protein
MWLSVIHSAGVCVFLDRLQFSFGSLLDSVIFERACSMAIEADCPLINPGPLVAHLAEQGVSESQIMETQEVLDTRGYIKLHRTSGPPQVHAFGVQQFGFGHYIRAAIPDFGNICTDVSRVLVRKECMSHRGIARRLNQPVFLIEHVFRLLESKSLIKYAESKGGGIHLDAFWVSPQLRRNLEANSDPSL